MDCRVLLCFAAIFSSHIQAYRIDRNEEPNNSFYDDDDYEYTYNDEESAKQNSVDNNGQNNNITTPRTATYEVTEDLVDIPNPSTKFGPIITNYTTQRPLNIASVANTENPNEKPQINNKSNNNGLSNNDNEDVKGKKNYYSIFHVKAEYDDVPKAPLNWSNLDNDQPKLGIKDYIYGISKGIYNKITRLFNKRNCDHDDKHELRTDYEQSHEFRSESSKTTDGFIHEFHDHLHNQHD